MKETWYSFVCKAVWKFDGRMWKRIGYRRYDTTVIQPFPVR